MKVGKKGLVLDPNSWNDALFWFEDEPEVFEFMQINEDIIKFYAEKNEMTVNGAIDYLFKESR